MTTTTLTAPPTQHVLTAAEFTRADLESLFATGHALKASPADFHQSLAGRTLVMLFEKPSLRTRISFEVGAAKLGAAAVFMDHAQSRLGERETVGDYARNLSLWTDAVVARTFGHGVVEELASAASVPVINGLSDLYHPCQALADWFSLVEVFGSAEGLPVAFIGDGNNVCNSLMLVGAALGAHVTAVCPPGHAPLEEALVAANHVAAGSGGTVSVTSDPGAVSGSAAVYTDTWVSMGHDGAEARKAALAPYQVNKELMSLAGPDAVFMHCLPAHRGEEVTAEVLDGPKSIVLRQAENRMHMQNALLLSLLTNKADQLKGAA